MAAKQPLRQHQNERRLTEFWFADLGSRPYRNREPAKLTRGFSLQVSRLVRGNGEEYPRTKAHPPP